LAGTWDGSVMRLYINGEEEGSLGFTGIIKTIDTSTFIGSYAGTSGQSPDGVIDECRISNVARGAAWINTSYLNQFDPDTFYSVGSEETLVGWDITLNLSESNGLKDWVVLGEAWDASDDKDCYDVPKPYPPPSPYVYAWFDANLSEPYDKLLKDYRSYPDTYKVWDLYVLWENSDSTNITISWNITQLNNGEYDFVNLEDVDLEVTIDMFLQSNYTYIASSMSVHHFQIICLVTVEYNYKIPLKEKWNFISLPVNQSIHKNNITVNYGGTNYSWQEAVSNSIILGYIYGWDAIAQNYVLTDILHPGKGNWMYAYHDCELWVSTNISNIDNYITNLIVKWNLIGLPFDLPVAKQNLTVFYNGTDYSWQEAVSNSIVLGYIYGWNATAQNYGLTNILSPGQGYWMYAYYDCFLKKE
jgi:hypothetical protein